MKKLIFFGLCFLLILAYGCSEAANGGDSSLPTVTQSEHESGVASASSQDAQESLESAVSSSEPSEEASSASQGGEESGESSVAPDVESSDRESGEASIEESSESVAAESSLPEQSQPSFESSEEESSIYVPEESSEYAPEESSKEPPIEESSVYVPEESSEYVPEESSSEPPIEESSEYIPEESSVEPPEESEDEDMQGIGDAELLPSGYLIYNGAAYSGTKYNPDAAQAYANTFARYAELFPNTRINVVTPPQSAIRIKNPDVSAMLDDQGEVLDLIESHIYGNVNFVNLRSIFEAHKGEYTHFKSDYHWTQLGAYYAYYEYAQSVGFTPTPLSSFEKKVVTDSFIGRSNEYALDDRILSFVDTIYAYMPTKEHTMTVYNSDLTVNRVYDNCIYTKRDTYSCFLTGDQPYTVINVPENDQDLTVLVIKESSANAFVPFLTEHYGNIIVIDPRSLIMDIRSLVEEQGVDDIIFHATASTSSRTAYNDYYRRLIGE